MYTFSPQAASRPNRRAKFDELLGELEEDRELREEVESARRWIANKFYSSPTLGSLRLQAGLSQKELGARCNLQQEHISRYETGRIEPKLTVASVLAAALGVSLDAFTEAWNNTRARVDASTTESGNR